MSILDGAHDVLLTRSHLYAIAGDFNQITHNYSTAFPLGADEERRSIAQWLSPLDFNATQLEIFQRRAKGIGQWLLRSKDFQEWCDGSSGTLFCHGMPGAGKTSLVSIVVNYLQTRFESIDDVGIAYIYLDYKKQTQQSPSDIISSLLKQLIQMRTACLDDIRLLYKRHEDRNSRPPLDDLTRALDIQISKHFKAFLVIDAIDELSQDSEAREILLRELQSFEGPVNLLVTSRNLPSVAVYFHDAKHLEIRAHDEDVRKYVKSRIPRWYPNNLEEQVTNRVAGTADGMFLLARLHMDSLLGKHSLAQVTRALQDLPMGMEHTYDEAMKRIDEQDDQTRALAYRVLTWITFTCRPLTVRELQYALSVSPGISSLIVQDLVFEECLTSYCAGLVVNDEKSRVVRFVHHSTQEYFEHRKSLLFTNGQGDITKTCITYLLFEDFGCGYTNDRWTLHLLMKKHPLLDYAARHWGYHARGEVEQVEKALLLEFLQSHHRIACASQILMLGPAFPLTKDVSALHLCAFFDLCETAKHKLQNGAKADAKDHHDRTPLSYAAINGQAGTVACLLTRKDVDVNSKDRWLYTPLCRAAANGHVGVVRLLLSHPAIDIDHRCSDNSTPLSLASKGGHDTIVHLLLLRGTVDINHKDDSGQTPLRIAAARGHSAVVSLLLAQETIDVNATDNEGQTPLSKAAEEGHTVAVSQLLAHPAVDVNVRNNEGSTALLLAAITGHCVIVSLLLAHETIDVNATTFDGQTPLSLASEIGHTDVVDSLLAHTGIDINVAEEDGWTVLLVAAWKGRSAVVSLLLSQEAIDVNVKDIRGRTPLSLAAENGHHDVTELLLAHKAIDINAADNYGSTPLSWAVEGGQSAVVTLLLAQETIDVNVKDIRGRTPLVLAALEGHHEVMKLLLAHKSIDTGVLRDYNGRLSFCAIDKETSASMDLLLAS